jgi:hypothetical protein
MMSGGSFNYLHSKFPEDLMVSGQSDLGDMIDALAVLGYAKDAAVESAGVLADICACQVRLEAKLRRLEGVWKAMEWWQSGDWSENVFKRALADYREVELPDCEYCGGTGLDPSDLDPSAVIGKLRCPDRYCAGGKSVEQIKR